MKSAASISLLHEIKILIRQEGPISVETYMNLCLTHPVHGYYMSRDPLGEKGDFITAPEISQIFGELLGLWGADTWLRLGQPIRINLVELGPGRGTLMSDALRAMAILPDMQKSLHIHCVEASPVLKRQQEQALQDFKADCHWHASLTTLPDGPLLVIANEFFDALPIRQYVKGRTGWHERLIGLNEEEHLTFGLAPDPEPSLAVAAREGSVLELSPARVQVMQDLARRLARQGGAALIIDYGYETTMFGETFQAMAGHEYKPVLEAPGFSDLTAHVDFASLERAARTEEVLIHGPISQARFLDQMSIAQRLKTLKAKASPSEQEKLERQVHRLTSSEGMGELFRVLGLSHPSLPVLAGF